jgi:hypothetical protein
MAQRRDLPTGTVTFFSSDIQIFSRAQLADALAAGGVAAL